MTDERATPPIDDAVADAEAVEAPRRGPRPVAIELAAALLIVTGLVQLFGAIGAANTLAPGSEGLVALSIALDVGTILAGLLTRSGRLWLLVVNYVAVLGFLDLLRITASPVALMLALVDAFALYALFTNRPWFARPRDDATDGRSDLAG
jgi:hypothetical protein